MMGWIRKKAPAPGIDELSALLAEAKRDEELGQRLRALLALDPLQRASILHTAAHEMRLRGEPTEYVSAYLLLANETLAQAARVELG